MQLQYHSPGPPKSRTNIYRLLERLSSRGIGGGFPAKGAIFQQQDSLLRDRLAFYLTVGFRHVSKAGLAQGISCFCWKVDPESGIPPIIMVPLLVPKRIRGGNAKSRESGNMFCAGRVGISHILAFLRLRGNSPENCFAVKVGTRCGNVWNLQLIPWYFDAPRASET